MIKYKIFLPILFLLWACNDQIKGFDDTDYDLYKDIIDGYRKIVI